MKYRQEPKPIEYEPLTIPKLELQKEMGPLEFTISKKSHTKSVELLNTLTSSSPVSLPTLLPSEMSGFARVLSNYFGRLNEVAVSKTRWKITGAAVPGERLKAYSRVIKTTIRKQLSFGQVETTTINQRGEVLLVSLDELLLLHDAPLGFYKEMKKRDEESFDYEVHRRVYHRYDWNPVIWKNNIHNDEYAQRFGYERGLPEFIVYMDWIFDAIFRQIGADAYASIINVPLILPVYIGEDIKLRLKKTERSFDVAFVKKDILRLKAQVLVE